MTDADDFKVAITVNPDDWHLQLIYADYLKENGQEELAEGWTAVAVNHRRPHRWMPGYGWVRRSGWYRGERQVLANHFSYCGRACVDDDWYDLMPKFAPRTGTNNELFTLDRQELFDALTDLAAAFCKLPVERRQQLLNPTPTQPLLTSVLL